MATRCIITFSDGNGKQVRTYRHWDGNPEEVIPELREFLEWNKGRNEDFAYAIANYFYFMKNKRVQETISTFERDKEYYTKVYDDYEATKKFNISREEHTGFGLLTDKDDWDTAYQYLVNLSTLEIEVL